MEAIARMTKCAKRYRSGFLKKVEALNGFDLSLRPGEVLGLMGPNGSGKSTAIRILLGLTAPDEGQVRLFSRPPWDAEAKRRIGYVPEENAWHPDLSGREFLLSQAALCGMRHRDAERRSDELLERMSLSGSANRKIREYSKGMRRRTAIAVSLISDPDLLVLDEPTNGLDPEGHRAFRELVSELAERGKAVLLSSHLLGEMEISCTRVQMIHLGRTILEGEWAELSADHSDRVLQFRELSKETTEAMRKVGRDFDPKFDFYPANQRRTLEDLFLEAIRDGKK